MLSVGNGGRGSRARIRVQACPESEIVNDPDRDLYRAFELTRGTPGQLFGPTVWRRGWQAGVRDGHGAGRLAGDGLQLPGACLVREGRIVHRFVHATAGDRPDDCALVSGSEPGEAHRSSVVPAHAGALG
jgi:hypothetical protein